ncbi:Putative disease resistance protein [Dendrobium catenatum]|uniref:Disease resistance protein n=1 Tax=Dendrobium catenatum TaxID=906689 RepID=A0A2I0VEV8_9ASPA|nr:Putative disease resistance protein [Dendrobium catenatum]
MFASFEICLPNLTKLVFEGITSCTLLPALGQLPKLRELAIEGASEVEKIGPEFFGSYDNATKIAFPKLQQLLIVDFPKLKEWSFGAQVEQNARLPCLQKLAIGRCQLLKQLPEDLKYSPIKFLKIFETRSLKSVDNLPAEIEEIELRQCGNLEKVFCPPTLKELSVLQCKDLAYVEKLDSLKKLSFFNIYSEGGLSEWLLKLLRQRRLQNDSNDDFQLQLTCTKEVFPECLEGGSYWDLIQHIPQVSCWGFDYIYYLQYSKQPYVYETNFYDILI